LKVQCLTARENTERPVTVEVGTNQLMGIDWEKIKDVALHTLSGRNKAGSIPELWDGKASERIVEILISKMR
jgi:UDP-N-acetylglucosamine 2-epimerase (non-hydrolysing)